MAEAFGFVTLSAEQDRKYDRLKLDDRAARYRFRDAQFDGRRTARDSFGNLLHLDKQAAIRKYGVANVQTHVVQVDHKVPLKTVFEFGSALGLSDEKIKEIANDESNFRLASAHFNETKKAKSDFQMAAEYWKNGERIEGAQLLADGTVGTINISGRLVAGVVEERVQVVAKQVPGGVKVATRMVAEEAAMPLMMAGIHNMVAVAQGEKTIIEGAKDSAVETGTAVLGARAQELGIQAANQALQRSGVQVMRQIAKANVIGNVVMLGMRVKGSLARYLDGRLSADEFIMEVGIQGCTLAAETVGATIGQTLIPIPVVGAVLGAMVASVACNAVADLMRTAKDCGKLQFVKDRRNLIEDIASQAQQEMARQRAELERLVKADLASWDAAEQAAFDLIYKGMQQNDVDTITRGLNTIVAQFGRKLTFEDHDSFHRAFQDPNYVFKL
ncbi:hypothetical protein [uncultured Selenomonas sp.]|uniref:hypothetical protein n=1 Tax=uncultured Selenomonas sp. TaxID=159275 RepID=UPI0025F3213A|nr:hypothetical protein [uncultured Selenomonas sp.]